MLLILDEELKINARSVIELMDEEQNRKRTWRLIGKFMQPIWDWDWKEKVGPNLDIPVELNGFTLEQPGFLGALAFAYSNHLPIQINPGDFWYLFLSEITKSIAKQPETFRDLFTKSAEKQTIQIPTDDPLKINVNVLLAALSARVKVDVTAFRPEFSNSSEGYNLATAAAFADICSHYYDYLTFMCGIPAIKIGGTLQDWQQGHICAMNIAQYFSEVSSGSALCAKLHNYAVYVGNLFLSVYNSLDSNSADLQFWKDIFTTKNVGSGGQLEINGWIKNMFIDMASSQSVLRMETAANTHSKVTWTNMESGRKFTAYHGPFGVKLNSDNFLESVFGSITIEHPKENAK